MSEASTFSIDDRDPRVTSNGDWSKGGGDGDYKNTLSSSTRVGDSFVVNFWGQSIVVYGLIDATSGGVTTNYSIDGSPPQQVISQRGLGDTHRQQFWGSQFLNGTQHQLTVTMAHINPDPEQGEGTIWFDYFAVYDPSGHEGQPPSPSAKLSKGAIAGTVVAAAVFVGLGVLIIWWIMYWRKRRVIQPPHPTKFLYWPWTPAQGHESRDTQENHFQKGEKTERQPKCAVKSLPWRPETRSRGTPVRKEIQPFVLGYDVTPLAPAAIYSAAQRSRTRIKRTLASDAGVIPWDLARRLEEEQQFSSRLSSANSSTDRLSSTATTVVECQERMDSENLSHGNGGAGAQP
ncbi:hypothetical protein D9756_006937 [Leucocoprinus leucothites]|uniref:Uncharacterized protein n=1 Tax=Leucocoprinus leucothites TaxID=201217 RepID=A0A8H5FYV4_9AGAR|nr:hypothetical protein D9756_006937 [Leucoagaricus leucothites]